MRTGLTAAPVAEHRLGMAKVEDPPSTERARRDEKLAAALRANLRRRKAGTAKPQAAAERKDDPKTP